MLKGLVWSAAAVLVALATSSADAQWGSIKGRILVEGEVTPLPPVVVKGAVVQNAEVCSAVDVPDESLVYDKDSKGLANVVVYLRKKPENAAQIHPKFEKPAAATVLYDQKGCKFIPHVAVVQTNQTLNIVSADPFAHNSRGSPLKNSGFNFIVAASDRVGFNVPFKLAENQPIEMRCDIHRWMVGHIMIVDHPYAVVSAADGTFTITDLPPGELEFRAWQERVGYLMPKEGERSFKVKVVAGQVTEVPTIKVPAKTLIDGK